MLGNLDGLPGVLKSRPSTVRTVLPLVGNAQTWICQTVRSEDGDTVFLELASREGLVRLVVPPKVVAAMRRQHDGLVNRARSRAAREAATTRAQAGMEPFGGKARRGRVAS